METNLLRYDALKKVMKRDVGVLPHFEPPYAHTSIEHLFRFFRGILQQISKCVILELNNKSRILTNNLRNIDR